MLGFYLLGIENNEQHPLKSAEGDRMPSGKISVFWRQPVALYEGNKGVCKMHNKEQVGS